MIFPPSISAMTSSTTMRVKPTSQLAKNLKFWMVARDDNTLIDVLTGEENTISAGTLTSSNNEEGFVISSVVGTEVGIAVEHDIGTGPFSMAARHFAIGFGTWNTVMQLPGANYAFYLPLSGAQQYPGAEAGGHVEWSTANFLTNTWHTFSLTNYGTGTAPDLWSDGLPHARSSGSTISYSAGTSDLNLFHRSGSEYSASSLAWCGLWNRPLSGVENYSLARDPTQMFEEHTTTMWIPAVSIAIGGRTYASYWM